MRSSGSSTKKLVWVYSLILVLCILLAHAKDPEQPGPTPPAQKSDAEQRMEQLIQENKLKEQMEAFKKVITDEKARAIYEASVAKSGSTIGHDPDVVRVWLEARNHKVDGSWTVGTNNPDDRSLSNIFMVIDNNRGVVIDLTARQMEGAEFAKDRIITGDDTQIVPGPKSGIVSFNGDTLIAKGDLTIHAGSETTIQTEDPNVDVNVGEHSLYVTKGKTLTVEPDGAGGHVVKNVHLYQIDPSDPNKLTHFGFQEGHIDASGKVRFRGEYSLSQEIKGKGFSSLVRGVIPIDPSKAVFAEYSKDPNCINCIHLSGKELRANFKDIPKAELTPIQLEKLTITNANELKVIMDKLAEGSKPTIEIFSANSDSKVSFWKTGVEVGAITGNGKYKGQAPGTYGAEMITIRPAGAKFEYYIMQDPSKPDDPLAVVVTIKADNAERNPKIQAIIDALKQLQGTSIKDGISINYGHKNPEHVRALQEALIAAGYLPQTMKINGIEKDQLDGKFGINTENAIALFQSKNNLEDDGQYGTNSNKKMIALLERRFTPEIGKIPSRDDVTSFEAVPVPREPEVQPAADKRAQVIEALKQAIQADADREFADAMARVLNTPAAREVIEAEQRLSSVSDLGKQAKIEPQPSSALESSEWNLRTWASDKAKSLLSSIGNTFFGFPEEADRARSEQERMRAIASGVELPSRVPTLADLEASVERLEEAQRAAEIATRRAAQEAQGGWGEQSVNERAEIERIVADTAAAREKAEQEVRLAWERINQLQRDEIKRQEELIAAQSNPNAATDEQVVLAPLESRIQDITTRADGFKPAKPFADTKGEVGFPVPSGSEIVARFGQTLEDGRTSMGVGFQTNGADQITSVADGKVVYSSLVRTDNGNLYNQLIINAGNGHYVLYRTIEGSTFTKGVGEQVFKGDTIGNMPNQFTYQKCVGNCNTETSGSKPMVTVPIHSSQPKLYVEFRKNGKPIDPDSWWIKG